MDKAVKGRKEVTSYTIIKATSIKTITTGTDKCTGFLPRLGEVSEVHLRNETPANATVVAILQQNSFLPAICLVTLRPVSTHSQVELYKLCPFSVQIPADQLPEPSLVHTDVCFNNK